MALVALSVIVSTNISFADTTSYTELAPIPGTGTNCIGGNETNCVVDTSAGGLGVYINNLYKVAVAGASVLAVLMLIMGGFSYVSTDAIDKKNDGKQQINNALGGLLLVLASWVILNTINPQLVSLNIVSTSLKSTDMASELQLSLINKKAQAAFDAVIAAANQDITDTKNAQQKLRELNANADELRSSLITMRAVRNWNSLSDEEKINYFGTTDENLIFGTTDPNEIQSQIDSLTDQNIADYQNEQTIALARADQIGAYATGMGVTKDAEASLIRGLFGQSNPNGVTAEAAQLKASYTKATQKMTAAQEQITAVDATAPNTLNSDLIKLKTATNATIQKVCATLPATIINRDYTGKQYECQQKYYYDKAGYENCMVGVKEQIPNPYYQDCIGQIIP